MDYRFITAPSTQIAIDIGGLYRAAGWWDEAPNEPEAIEKMVAGSHCFVLAMDGDTPVGMGRALSDGVSDAYIQDVTVARDWRGQGIAGGIVETLIERLRMDGIDWIGLVSERGTHELYKNFGFDEIPESKALLLKG